MENKKIEDLMKQAEEFAKSIGYDPKTPPTEKDLPLKIMQKVKQSLDEDDLDNLESNKSIKFYPNKNKSDLDNDDNENDYLNDEEPDENEDPDIPDEDYDNYELNDEFKININID